VTPPARGAFFRDSGPGSSEGREWRMGPSRGREEHREIIKAKKLRNLTNNKNPKQIKE
jgi:hypothetical protein